MSGDVQLLLILTCYSFLSVDANQLGGTYNCTGWFFATMNLCVHSVMYTYYGLSAFSRDLRKAMAKIKINLLLTTLQIAQMFAGIYFVYLSSQCSTVNQTSLMYAVVMYSSYALLFSLLFLEKYVWAKKTEDKKAKQN